MKQLSKQQRCAIIRCLVDGVSVRATCRITGVAKGTVQKLTRDLGEEVLKFMGNAIVNINARRIQCDEIWCFCYAKEKNLPDNLKDKPGVGSIWTWTAMDAQTKLIISWRLGSRDAETGNEFMQDVQSRLANRVQLTSDGHTVYLDAVEQAFGSAIDFAQLIKLYGEDKTSDTRYSPGKCLGAKKQAVMGNPDEDHISTSYAERQNLNIRMQNRRFTRLTNFRPGSPDTRHDASDGGRHRAQQMEHRRFGRSAPDFELQHTAGEKSSIRLTHYRPLQLVLDCG